MLEIRLWALGLFAVTLSSAWVGCLLGLFYVGGGCLQLNWFCGLLGMVGDVAVGCV